MNRAQRLLGDAVCDARFSAADATELAVLLAKMDHNPHHETQVLELLKRMDERATDIMNTLKAVKALREESVPARLKARHAATAEASV